MRGTVAWLIWAACALEPQPSPRPSALRSEVLGAVEGWRLESRCSEHACTPVLVPLAQGGSEAVLPLVESDRPWAVDGVELTSLERVDLDGDAQPEVKVVWRSIGTPRAALGSWRRNLVTVLDGRSGALRLHVETGSAGGASERHCTGTLTFQSAGAILVQQCQLGACVLGGARPGECEAGPDTRTRRVLWVE